MFRKIIAFYMFLLSSFGGATDLTGGSVYAIGALEKISVAGFTSPEYPRTQNKLAEKRDDLPDGSLQKKFFTDYLLLNHAIDDFLHIYYENEKKTKKEEFEAREDRESVKKIDGSLSKAYRAPRSILALFKDALDQEASVAEALSIALSPSILKKAGSLPVVSSEKRLMFFDEMTRKILELYCNYVRAAMLPLLKNAPLYFLHETQSPQDRHEKTEHMKEFLDGLTAYYSNLVKKLINSLRKDENTKRLLEPLLDYVETMLFLAQQKKRLMDVSESTDVSERQSTKDAVIIGIELMKQRLEKDALFYKLVNDAADEFAQITQEWPAEQKYAPLPGESTILGDGAENMPQESGMEGFRE